MQKPETSNGHRIYSLEVGRLEEGNHKSESHLLCIETRISYLFLLLAGFLKFQLSEYCLPYFCYMMLDVSLEIESFFFLTSVNLFLNVLK